MAFFLGISFISLMECCCYGASAAKKKYQERMKMMQVTNSNSLDDDDEEEVDGGRSAPPAVDTNRNVGQTQGGSNKTARNKRVVLADVKVPGRTK